MSEPEAPPFLDQARGIGERLCREAVWHDGRCTWLGDDMGPVEGQWTVVHGTIGGEVYSGTAGIARFLAYLWRATGDEAARRAAEAALRQALRWASSNGSGRPLGLLDGVAGVACAAVEIGSLLGSEELHGRGVENARRLADRPPEGELACSPDLVGGAAGRLLALLHLSAHLGDAELLEACAELGLQLLAAANRTPSGWSWTGDPAAGTLGLCGLGHGASGIAHALRELGATTGDEAYTCAAVEAERYERGWFDRAQGNWPDLRGVSAEDLSLDRPLPAPVYWCHGAVGIGMARLRAWELSGERRALAEAGAALETARGAAGALLHGPPTPASPFEANLSLCHGMAGIAELFLVAHEVLGVAEHLETARWIGDWAIERAWADGGEWPCGVPGGGEAPGLMLGLAGIGAMLLRLHDPAAMPSVGLWPKGPGRSRGDDARRSQPAVSQTR